MPLIGRGASNASRGNAMTRGRTVSGRVVSAEEAKENEEKAEAARVAAAGVRTFPYLNQEQSYRGPSGRLPVFRTFAPSDTLPPPSFKNDYTGEGGYTQIKKRKYTRTRLGEKKQHRRRRRRHSTKKYRK